MFHFVLTASCTTMNNTEKSIFFTLSPSHIYTHYRLLQAAESHFSQPLLILQILQALNHIHISFLDSFQYIYPCLASKWWVQTECPTPDLSSADGKITFITSITSPKLSLMQARRLLIFLLQWHIAGSQSASTLGSFPAGLITSVSSWSTNSRAAALHSSVPAWSFKFFSLYPLTTLST